MKTMREKFEGLEKIKDILEEYKSDVIIFDEEKGEYKATLYVTFVPEYIEWLNGAWYAFQDQQQKIDAIKDNVKSFYAESELWGFDSDQALRQVELIRWLLNESQSK